jgi:hypothetical protein
MDKIRSRGRPRTHFRGFETLTDLGELRAVFGIQIAQLAVKYGIDVEEELASILPIEDKEDKRLRVRRKTN